MPLVRPPVPCVLAVPGTLPSPARDPGSYGLEMPPRHHGPLRAVAAPNALAGCILPGSAHTLAGCILPEPRLTRPDSRAAQQTWELDKTPHDQKHLYHPGDTFKVLNTLRFTQSELRAPASCAELAVQGSTRRPG